MTMNVTTHLNFRGEARAALEFYQSVFGGELVAFTYRDAQRVVDPAEADQIVWGQVAADNGFQVMAYDVPSRMAWNQGDNAFFVSVRFDSAEEITTYWERLTDGATVLEDLGPSGWAPLYGMVRDRFGVTWVLDVAVAYSAA